MRAFKDRTEAGRILSEKLLDYAGREDVQILALPRGGVPVGFEVARRLRAPLNIFVVRKLGVPGRPELAMGALASGGIRVLNRQVIEALDIDERMIEEVTERERASVAEVEERLGAYSDPAHIRAKTVILVDDGLATGATMNAAVHAARTHEPAHVVVAVPTASPEAAGLLRESADQLVCVMTPASFQGVGAWYQDFAQVDDADVGRLLQRSRDEE